MVDIQGFAASRFSAVRDAFAGNFEQGLENGARFTLVQAGEVVVVSAGHPPPVIRRATGEVQVADLSVDPPVGAPGESVAVGPGGNVFVANGQVFVYAPDGKPLGQIDVPERPIQLIFGGADHRTLFILTHHALYAVTV